MRYSIKQMANLLGTTTHKLRYYQKLDIISPVSDIQNGYRYYSVLDTRRFNLACMYTDLGFSLNETVKILKHSKSDELIEKLNLQKEVIAKEILFKQLCLEKIDEFNRFFSIFDRLKNEVIEIELDDILRLEFSNQEIIEQNEHLIHLRNEVLKYSPLVQWVSRIPSPIVDLKEGELEYHFGLNINYQHALKLNLDVTQFQMIPKGKYLITIYEKKNRDPFGFDSFHRLQDYLKKHGISSHLDCYSSIVHSIAHNDHYLNYHYLLLKLT